MNINKSPKVLKKRKSREKISTVTTIKISKITKQRIDKLKEYDKESYEEILKKILNILNTCIKRPTIASKMIRNIEISKKRRLGMSKPK